MKSYFAILKRVTPARYLLLLVLCILAVYVKTFFNDFQDAWDDQNVILACPYLGNWSSLVSMFTQPYAEQYSPVNTLFLNIIYSLFGAKPLAFHAFSLLLHCINSIIVFKVAQMILNKTGYREKQATVYSLIVASLFALHPMQVESVAWASASKIPLYSLFTLCGLSGWQKYLNNGKLVNYILTIACMILACGTKEQAVVFPFLLLLWDWLNNRKLPDIDLWLEKLPFFIIALGFGFITMQLQTGAAWVLPYSLWNRLLFVSISFVEYIFKAIIPVNLSYFYPFPMEPGKHVPPLLWMYPLVFAIILWWGIESLRKGRKLAFFGLLFFTINLLLSIHIIPLSRQFIIADRYIYLSIIGLVLVGIDFWQLYIEPRKAWRKAYMVTICMLVCYYTIYSFIRVGVWKDSDTLKKITNKEAIYNTIKEGTVVQTSQQSM